MLWIWAPCYKTFFSLIRQSFKPVHLLLSLISTLVYEIWACLQVTKVENTVYTGWLQALPTNIIPGGRLASQSIVSITAWKGFIVVALLWMLPDWNLRIDLWYECVALPIESKLSLRCTWLKVWTIFLYHFTILHIHHFTLLPFYSYYFTIILFYHFILLFLYHFTLLPFCSFTILPYFFNTISPFHHMNFRPFYPIPNLPSMLYHFVLYHFYHSTILLFQVLLYNNLKIYEVSDDITQNNITPPEQIDVNELV